MTPEEELVCHPVNRDLFVAWHNGEITLEEAVYIVRRCEFEWRIEWMPKPLSAVLIWFHELFYEPCHDPGDDAKNEPGKEAVDDRH